MVSNVLFVQDVFTTFTPLFWRLNPILLTGEELMLGLVITVSVVLACLIPLYKPQPRRILDTFFLVQKRVIVAAFALATLGYFNYSYRLPRTTLALSFGFLLLLLPLWFVWISHRPGDDDQIVLVGDDPDQIAEIAENEERQFVGYLCPTIVERELPKEMIRADGGTIELPHLGGLSRLEDVFGSGIDTVVLAFKEPDRGEFFGVLDACYEHGVNAKVHQRYADVILVGDAEKDEMLVDVAIQPWDPQDYVLKRGFDLMFAGIGLLAVLPICLLIALFIKLDDGGPIFYRQERTSEFGAAFSVFKFRTMIEGAERIDTSQKLNASEDRDPRVTRVGSLLRRTHLDEIPQLWSIVTGDMSVVGPRPVWIEEELQIEVDVDAKQWRRRWFIKPGLTGLAQIADVDSSRPEEKLRYDLEYIRRQSFWLDVRIVLRQLWKVFGDVPG